jgi:hypothetical protein
MMKRATPNTTVETEKSDHNGIAAVTSEQSSDQTCGRSPHHNNTENNGERSCLDSEKLMAHIIARMNVRIEGLSQSRISGARATGLEISM